jgi:hypothetical protein
MVLAVRRLGNVCLRLYLHPTADIRAGVLLTRSGFGACLLAQVSVQYTPMDTDQAKYDAYYKLTDPEQQMRAYVFDCVRSSVPKIILDNVFEVRMGPLLDHRRGGKSQWRVATG